MTVLDDGCSTKTAAGQLDDAAAIHKAKMLLYLRPPRMEDEEYARMMRHRPIGRPSNPVEDNARVRGHAALNDLLADYCINAGMASRGRQLIEVLFKPHTIDASIAPEDDGLIFYWAARNMTITIQIFPSGDYWWSVRNIAGETYSDAGFHLPLPQLRRSLNHFSKEVERQNPNWRNTIR